MQWKGQNTAEVTKFIEALPDTMKITANPVMSVSDRRVLRISGYRCSGKGETIYLNPYDYLISSFSEIDGTFTLMAICLEEFEGCFKRGRARPKLTRPVESKIVLHPGSSGDRIYRENGSILVSKPDIGGCAGCYLANLSCGPYPCTSGERYDKKPCIWVLSPERWK